MGGTWVLVASERELAVARPLLDAHARHRPVRVIRRWVDGPVPAAALDEWAADAAGVLVIGDGRRAPRTAVPGPFAVTANGRPVPVGWLPSGGRGAGLEQFVAAAARVADRPATGFPTIALLAQWVPRYLQLARRMDHHLPVEAGRVTWTAERITRDDLVVGLGSGLGCAVYFGHGRPSGWAAYHGVRSHHLTAPGPAEPLGSLVSMTCYTASRWRVGASFAEGVVIGGAAAAAIGAVAPVEHLDNARWMLGFAAALHRGETAVGPALASALGGTPPGASPYRIIGDPLAALAGTPDGWARARAVSADPAPADPPVRTLEGAVR